MHVFEVTDKTGRNIRLTKERWTHIVEKHPFMATYLAEIKQTLIGPQTIIAHSRGNLHDYFMFYKHKKGNLKFLQVVSKYLNGTGFVLTAYFARNI